MLRKGSTDFEGFFPCAMGSHCFVKLFGECGARMVHESAQLERLLRVKGVEDLYGRRVGGFRCWNFMIGFF